MGRLRWRVLAAALLLGPLAWSGCRAGEAADYDASFQRDFLARCSESFGRPGAPQVCGCWYEGLVDAVAFEDLPPMDDLVADDFAIAPTRVPGGDLDVPLEVLATCVRTLGAAPTVGSVVPPPTTPRPPTTPTTATTVAP
jgi:hypothetical protein